MTLLQKLEGRYHGPLEYSFLKDEHVHCFTFILMFIMLVIPVVITGEKVEKESADETGQQRILYLVLETMLLLMQIKNTFVFFA